MTALPSSHNDFAQSAEKAGVAAAAALRKLPLAAENLAPSRLFNAIASMADTSSAAAVEYEKAALATLRQEIAEAEASIARANALADKLNEALSGEIPIPLPNFLKRKR